MKAFLDLENYILKLLCVLIDGPNENVRIQKK